MHIHDNINQLSSSSPPCSTNTSYSSSPVSRTILSPDATFQRTILKPLPAPCIFQSIYPPFMLFFATTSDWQLTLFERLGLMRYDENKRCRRGISERVEEVLWGSGGEQSDNLGYSSYKWDCGTGRILRKLWMAKQQTIAFIHDIIWEENKHFRKFAIKS